MKRLFKIKEGSKLAGVCNGLSDYLNFDVTLIRLAFILLAFTSIGVLAYIVLAILLPEKNFHVR